CLFSDLHGKGGRTSQPSRTAFRFGCAAPRDGSMNSWHYLHPTPLSLTVQRITSLRRFGTGLSARHLGCGCISTWPGGNPEGTTLEVNAASIGGYSGHLSLYPSG